MKRLKSNTEATTLDRLRIVVGMLMSLSGVALAVLQLISNSFGALPWTVVIGLLIGGFFVAGSHKVIMFILELF